MFVGTKTAQRETGHCPSLRRGRFVAIHAMRALHVRLAALPAKRPAARGAQRRRGRPRRPRPVQPAAAHSRVDDGWIH